MNRRVPRRADDDDECNNACIGVGYYTGEMEVERTRDEVDALRPMDPIGFVRFPAKTEERPAAKRPKPKRKKHAGR